ncbi:hypothetical protein MRX96_056078 [Rhipicephalus microplus]
MAPKTKLFVGHLPDGLHTEELSELFSKYGTVAERDVINKYGFVHMSTEEEAKEALKNLNNYNFMGSTLSVERSTSKFHQEPGAPGRAKGGPSPHPYFYHPGYAEWLAFFMNRPPYGGGMARNGYDGRGSGGYYNGGPGGYGDYRRGGDFYDRAPYRAMVAVEKARPNTYTRSAIQHCPVEGAVMWGPQ